MNWIDLFKDRIGQSDEIKAANAKMRRDINRVEGGVFNIWNLLRNTNDGKETNQEGNGGNQGQESKSYQGQEND